MRRTDWLTGRNAAMHAQTTVPLSPRIPSRATNSAGCSAQETGSVHDMRAPGYAAPSGTKRPRLSADSCPPSPGHAPGNGRSCATKSGVANHEKRPFDKRALRRAATTSPRRAIGGRTGLVYPAGLRSPALKDGKKPVATMDIAVPMGHTVAPVGSGTLYGTASRCSSSR